MDTNKQIRTNNTDMPIKMQDNLRAIEFGNVYKSVHVPKQLYDVANEFLVQNVYNPK